MASDRSVQGSLQARPRITVEASVGDAAQVGQDLVEVALRGASDVDLVTFLGNALTAVGLDVSTIEIACDAVDPERAQHFIRWRRSAGIVGGDILAEDVFLRMLEDESEMFRFADGRREFAAIMQDNATDAVAFAAHLAPDVTVGFFDDVMSVFATERPGGFTSHDIDLLTRVTPVFSLALGARLNAAAARTLLQTYLGPGAAAALLDGRVGLGEVEEIRAVVVYCDLSGFTSLTEKLDARSLIETLNFFFETMTRPASRAGGQVSGHVGDAVVLYFPIVGTSTERSVCAAAVEAALEGLHDLDRPNASPTRTIAVPLRARVGVDIGEVVHGNIGSAGRFSFTIIGTPVNRAARLQALAKDLDATVLMTSDLADTAGVRCSAFGRHALRGFDEPVDVVGFGGRDDRAPEAMAQPSRHPSDDR